MPTRFIYLLISTVGSACWDFFSKFLFDKYPKLTVAGMMTYGWLIEIVGLLIYVLVTGKDINLFNQSSMFLGLLGGILCIRFIGNKLYYEGMKKLDVSLVAILFTFSTIVSVVVGIRYHGESITFYKVLWVLLIMWAIIAINYQNNINISDKKFILFVLGSAVIYGIVANVEKIVWLDFDPFIFRLYYSLFSIALFGIIYPKDLKQDFKYTKEGYFRWINLLASLSFSVWNICSLLAFKYGAEAGKLDAINNASIFIIILLEVIFLHNRDNLKLKIVLSVLTFIGMFLLRL